MRVLDRKEERKCERAKIFFGERHCNRSQRGRESQLLVEYW